MLRRYEEELSKVKPNYLHLIYDEIDDAAELGWHLTDDYITNLINDVLDQQQFDEYLEEQDWVNKMTNETQYQGYIILN